MFAHRAFAYCAARAALRAFASDVPVGRPLESQVVAQHRACVVGAERACGRCSSGTTNLDEVLDARRLGLEDQHEAVGGAAREPTLPSRRPTCRALQAKVLRRARSAKVDLAKVSFSRRISRRCDRSKGLVKVGRLWECAPSGRLVEPQVGEDRPPGPS